ncbi:hypothetical protein Vpro01_02600 [Vibrio proteolyticus]
MVLPIIVFTGVIFFASQVYMFRLSLQREETNLIERVTVLAGGIAHNLHTSLYSEDSLAAQLALSAFNADPDVLGVKLFTRSGQLFASYVSPGFKFSQEDERQLSGLTSGIHIGQNCIYSAIQIQWGEKSIAVLKMAISKDSLKLLYRTAVENSVLFLTLMIVASVVLYLTVQKYIVHPVFALNRAMGDFIDNRSRRIMLYPESNDQIGELFTAFNTMVERLGQHEKRVTFALDKLEVEKAFANEVIETVQHALLVVNRKGEIVHHNAASREVFSCTDDVIQNACLMDLFRVPDCSLFDDALNCGKTFDDELVWVTDLLSRKILLQVSCRVLSRSEQMLFAIQDVTEEEAHRARQRLAAGVFENSHDGLMVLDHDGVITMVNPAFSRMLGYHQNTVLGKPPGEVMDWHQLTSLMPTITDAAFEYGLWQGEIWEKHIDGRLIPMFVKVNLIQNHESSSAYDLVFIFSDLSSTKEMERLEYLAHHDSLTGLGNRAQLCRIVDELLANFSEHQGFGVLYLDLDGFKAVNDTFGHDAGDAVLKQISERLLSQVRAHDLVSRLSGDEFVIIVNHTDRENTIKLAKRLLQLFREPVVYQGQTLHVGSSVGVYYVEHGNETLDSILKKADAAMYRAKMQGKGRLVLA